MISFRTFDFKAFASWPSDKLERFVVSCCEQYLVVLSNDSLAQRKMVKMVELRDFLGFPMVNPFRMATALKHIAPIGAMYPEMIYRLIGVNSPRAIVNMIAVAQPVMRSLFKKWFPNRINEAEMERNDAKLIIIPIGDWDWVAEHGIGTLCTWAKAVPMRGFGEKSQRG